MHNYRVECVCKLLAHAVHSYIYTCTFTICNSPELTWMSVVQRAARFEPSSQWRVARPRWIAGAQHPAQSTPQFNRAVLLPPWSVLVTITLSPNRLSSSTALTASCIIIRRLQVIAYTAESMKSYSTAKQCTLVNHGQAYEPKGKFAAWHIILHIVMVCDQLVLPILYISYFCRHAAGHGYLQHMPGTC